MRKWIVTTAIVASLGGVALGVIAGTYFGFHVATSQHVVTLADRAIADSGLNATYYQLVRDGDLEQLEEFSRDRMLLEAHAITYYFDFLDQSKQTDARRLFHRVLLAAGDYEPKARGKRMILERLGRYAEP